MSNSAINQGVLQAKVNNVQNAADSSAVYSAGAWSFKNSSAVTSVQIDNSGNVGVGITPVSVLDVLKVSAATNPVSDNTFPSWTSGLTLRNTSTTDGAYASLSFLTGNAAGTGQGFSIVGQSTNSGFSSNLLFMARTASGTTTERGRIDSAGVWTFGSTSGTTDNRRHTFSGYTLTTDIDILTVENRATSTTADATYAIRCVKGSGTNTTAQRFVAFTNTAGGIGNGQINGNGSGAAAFGSYSDRRLKENIVPLAGELQKVLALNPVEFDYKDGSGHQFGFIAQEIEEVYPDAVSVLGETEEMKTVTGWDKTTARLVKAIQELSAKVEEQSLRLEAQAAEIEALKAS